MLVGFVCPDGEKIDLAGCFVKCRLGERCLTLPTLVYISREREWAGTVSTTQCINGTMLEYLKLTKPYYIDPDSRAFMLAGMRHHKVLEEVAKELGLPAEVALSVDRDIFDLLEWEGDVAILTDRKLYGSYKVAKMLGMVKVGKQPDPSGAVYKTSGRWGKAGSPKMVNVFEAREEAIDAWEAEYQLNNYLLKLRDLGIKWPFKLQVEAVVRDGGLDIARNRGLTRNIYKIPIKILPDSDIRAYFAYKQEALLKALAEGWDEPCNPAESWDGIRCERFCDVWDYCPKGILIHGIGGTDARDDSL